MNDQIPLTLDAAIDATRFGHKAATLAALLNAGHKVPDGFVIPIGGSTAAAVLGAALERLGPGPYAVRSSGVAEDLADASFAGQYETVLGAQTLDEVVAAAARVLASGSAKHALAYRAHTDLGDEASAPLGVLVQRLVAADAAGVMFSRNPVTGDDEVVLEAVRGLGDRLVAGDVDGDRWVEHNGELEAQADSGVIDASTARKLTALARRIAEERGAPQDIEWAIADGELYVLQARPITGLPVPPAITVPPGRWMKDTGHFHGPLTPMGASIILPVYESAIGSAICDDFGLPLETIRQRSFGGEVYTQEVELGGGHSTGAPPPWWVLAIVARVLPAMRRRMKTAAAAIAKLEEYPRLWDTRWRRECLERIEAASAVDLSALSDDALLDELDRVVDGLMLDHMKIHFGLTAPNMVGVYELVRCCEELLGWDITHTMNLLTGLSTTTTQPDREMAAIAAELDPSVLNAGLDAVRASAVAPKLDAWLAIWGLRTIDTDPGSPTIAERDDLILGLLRSAREHSSDLEDKRTAVVAEARAALDDAGRERFDRALAYAEWVYPQREGNVPYTEGIPCGLARRVLLEIGKRLKDNGVLHAIEDVAFLERSELRPAMKDELEAETAAQRVRRRRCEHAWVLAHPGPAIHGPAPVPPPDVRGLPAAARRIMEAAVWGIDHELSPPTAEKHEDGLLKGVAASPGRYTGRVRVIRHEAELQRLEQGEVLVCPTTHSSWSVVFSRAGALVTDGGGMLAHPAIIAREHNIPAVLATCHATSTLRDGQTVTVDGIRGLVEIHE